MQPILVDVLATTGDVETEKAETSPRLSHAPKIKSMLRNAKTVDVEAQLPKGSPEQRQSKFTFLSAFKGVVTWTADIPVGFLAELFETDGIFENEACLRPKAEEDDPESFSQFFGGNSAHGFLH